jgi:hypothetical protein
VHQSGGVDGGQALGEAGREGPGGRRRRRAVVADGLGERRAGYVGGRQPGLRSGGVRVHHRGGEHAADAPGRGHLAGEPGADDLHRDQPPSGRAPYVYATHAARAEAAC